jgi:hypothetical protein
MKTFTTIVLVLLTAGTFGQQLFHKTFIKPDWDYADAVIERYDGNYLIAGSSRSQFGTDYDINLILVDSLGNLIWDKYLGQADSLEFSYSLIETSEKNYLISGRIGDYFPYLLLFDIEGNIIRDMRYPEENNCYGAYSLGETEDSNYYFIESGPISTLYVVKPSGDTISTRKFDFAFCHSVIQTSDLGYMLVGNTTYPSEYQGIILIKTDPLGDTLWTKTFGDEGNDDAFSVQQLADDGYIIAGAYNDPNIFDEDDQTYLIRTNSSGDTLWTKKYWLGSPNFIQVSQNNNGFIMSSELRIWTGDPNYDEFYIFITRFDTLGNILWSRQFEGYTYDIGNNVTQTSDGGFLLTGYYENYPIKPDIILIKLDSIGDYVLTTKDITSRSLSGVIVYPNPAKEILILKLIDNDLEIKLVRVFNSFGQEIQNLSISFEREIKIDIEHLPSGIYFYDVVTRKNQTLIGKFIVN